LHFDSIPPILAVCTPGNSLIAYWQRKSVMHLGSHRRSIRAPSDSYWNYTVISNYDASPETREARVRQAWCCRFRIVYRPGILFPESIVCQDLPARLLAAFVYGASVDAIWGKW